MDATIPRSHGKTGSSPPMELVDMFGLLQLQYGTAYVGFRVGRWSRAVWEQVLQLAGYPAS